MYSETDIDAAVASGALTRQAADALRASVAAGRQAPAADEESFRLLTGFNDIFVSIALVLLLVALGWIGATTAGGLVTVTDWPGRLSPTGVFIHEFDPRSLARHAAAMSSGGGLLVAAASWLLAEYFTRRRRMALPSILLLATFTLAVSIATTALVTLATGAPAYAFVQFGGATAGLVTALAAWAHWRRFHVPITVAAGVGALAMFATGLVAAAVPQSRALWLWALFAAGLATFALAMWWDMLDRARTTRRADVAFWLHLAAAPMIAHPVFNLLGVLGDQVTLVTVAAVLLLYLLFGLVALAVDRRALLVSGLLYVLVALADLFRQVGAVSLNVALTALVIGSALLLLSAFWGQARARVLALLPEQLAARLPAAR